LSEMNAISFTRERNVDAVVDDQCTAMGASQIPRDTGDLEKVSGEYGLDTQLKQLNPAFQERAKNRLGGAAVRLLGIQNSVERRQRKPGRRRRHEAV
jgi:hypothetical protein